MIHTLDRIQEILEHPLAGRMLAALLIFCGGVIFAYLVGWLLRRWLTKIMDDQQTLLVRRVVFWGLIAVATLSALREVGFNPTVLLGTAGVLTVALGFAAQTSASNFISGLFLVSERAIAIGDRIRINDMLADVVSIDTLSVKVRTLDNLHVRIPNETMLKGTITTLNRYPIRRYDLAIGVAYRTDLALARHTLLEVARANPIALDQPEPSTFFLGFDDNAMTLRLSAWATQDNFFQLMTELPDAVKAALDAAGIEIAFPQRTLHVPDGIVLRSEPAPAERLPAPDDPPLSPDATPPSPERLPEGATLLPADEPESR